MRFQLPCLTDTGANYTLIDAKAAQDNGLQIEEADNYTVEGAGKNLLPVTGISPVTFQLDTQKVSTTAIIVKGLSYKVLLGCFQSQILGIIPLSFPNRMPPCNYCKNRHEDSAPSETQCPSCLTYHDSIVNLSLIHI